MHDDERLDGRLRRWAEAEAQPALDQDLGPFEVWRSQAFRAQLFREPGGWERVTVNRNAGPNSHCFPDGISWDELQQIKAQIGRGERWAAELYPPEDEVVNIANMRHLWLLDERPPFGWTRCGHAGTTTSVRRWR